MSNQQKRNRADKTEYLRRIYTIMGWIIEGIQPALICKQIIDNKWCESQRHAERMLKAARDKWTEIPEADLHQKRSLKVLQLEQLKRSLKPEYKGTPQGIRAQKEIEKEIILLEGLRKQNFKDNFIPEAMPVQSETVQTILYLPKNGRDDK